MRTYQLKAGKRAELLEIFKTKSMPAHAEIGMTIAGPYEPIEDPDTFSFMPVLPELASREPMKPLSYEGDLWNNELEQVLMPMIERYEAVLVEAPRVLELVWRCLVFDIAVRPCARNSSTGSHAKHGE